MQGGISFSDVNCKSEDRMSTFKQYKNVNTTQAALKKYMGCGELKEKQKSSRNGYIANIKNKLQYS